ncbi:hypothetical protein ARAM_007010 [Aspergillus rambellii]|uniref:Aminoglycoside phosphotransferase domain-containing protein n=1 Tax=Aspergillus rambellii TaxID=308745 RepID=A0A0F8WL92_9EURO|nr:hypothetical protein ARAM_007010 [Aspergillus rambellii]
MTKTRRLLHEEITFSLAKEREVNVLHQLDYHDKQTRFFSLLSSRRAWSAKQNDIKLRENLFRDLSRILLRISRIPLPRIGSFIIDSDGFLCLSNRPLSIEIENLENEKIPTHIPCCYTYSTVDSYVADMLRVHDSRLRHQPNAVNNLQDCAYQMSALAAMRATAVLFFRGDFRRGPFVFTLTDLHQSNIFVDENWHITSHVLWIWNGLALAQLKWLNLLTG